MQRNAMFQEWSDGYGKNLKFTNHPDKFQKRSQMTQNEYITPTKYIYSQTKQHVYKKPNKLQKMTTDNITQVYKKSTWKHEKQHKQRS